MSEQLEVVTQCQAKLHAVPLLQKGVSYRNEIERGILCGCEIVDPQFRGKIAVPCPDRGVGDGIERL